MSQLDADRLINDLDSNQDLYKQIHEASKKVLDVARANGYDVNENEVRTALNNKLGTSIPMQPPGNTGDPGGGNPGGGNPGGGNPGDPGDPGADPMTCFVLSETPGH